MGIRSFATVLAALASLALVGCGGGSDYSSTLESSIKTDGLSQINANLPEQIPPLVATIVDTSCLETGSSQVYTCVVHYTVDDGTAGSTQNFTVNIDGTCNDAGTCQWHSDGASIPAN